MIGLIGKKFKRNVYGLSIWTDEIKSVGFKKQLIVPYKRKYDRFDKEKREHHQSFGYKIEIFVRGYLSEQEYSINEIIVYE